MKMNINDPDPYVRMAAGEVLCCFKEQLSNLLASFSEEERRRIAHIVHLTLQVMDLQDGKDIDVYYDPT